MLLERLKSMSIESRPAKAAALCEFTADDLKTMNDFVHYDLRTHANENDPCRYHCLQWGLADHNGHACDHEHLADCASCRKLFRLIGALAALAGITYQRQPRRLIPQARGQQEEAGVSDKEQQEEQERVRIKDFCRRTKSTNWWMLWYFRAGCIAMAQCNTTP